MVEGQKRAGVKMTKIAIYACALILFGFCFSTQASATEAKSSCITCHSDPNFATFNNKLRFYFLKWESSTHAYEGVTCNDCHGGNPGESDKKKAHIGKKNSIYFTDIPKTCGKCHDSIYESFAKSYHYKYLETPDASSIHGPNCITCHSAGDADMGMGANPEEVKKACELCHNYKTKNFPAIPEKAMEILVRFNSVKQQFNNLIVRSDIIPSQKFIDSSRKKINELSVAFHSFDLNLAGQKTDEILALLKEERTLLRKIKTDRIYNKAKEDQLYNN